MKLKSAFLMVFLIALAASSLTAPGVQSVEASGTIYIGADGSLNPPTAPISTLDNITYTFADNINDSILVLRDNIIIDGDGCTLQGTGVDYSKGIDLSGRTNVTVKNTQIENFTYGIYLNSSSENVIYRSKLAKNDYGIYLYSSFDNSISGNNMTKNSYSGTRLVYSSNNSIGGNDMANTHIGITLFFSWSNSIIGNNMTANDFDGIYLYHSNTTSVIRNSMTDNNNGVTFLASSDNSMSGNNIKNNSECGIWFYGSSNNSISGNNIANNSECGIWFYSSSNNKIYHNNFVDNPQQVCDNVSELGSVNVWDGGFPSGGNFWSDYNGTDANHDGVGDTPYIIDANNTDNYPLMGMYSSFNVTYFTPALEPHNCSVTVISNSTISDFSAPRGIEHPEIIILVFYVTGEQGTPGFCRVSFPTAMMHDEYHVYVNGTQVKYTLLPFSDANMSYLYFNYTHSTQEVIVTPEFPSFLILPLVFTVTLLAVLVYGRKQFHSTER